MPKKKKQSTTLVIWSQYEFAYLLPHMSGEKGIWFVPHTISMSPADQTKFSYLIWLETVVFFSTFINLCDFAKNKKQKITQFQTRFFGASSFFFHFKLFVLFSLRLNWTQKKNMKCVRFLFVHCVDFFFLLWICIPCLPK